MKEGKILIKIQAGVTFELFKKMLLHPMLTVITIFSVGNLIGNYFDSIFEKKMWNDQTEGYAQCAKN